MISRESVVYLFGKKCVYVEVCDGVFQHIDVQEYDKEQPFTLGKRLTIGVEEFEDIEEILSRWIQPMASFAREVSVLWRGRERDGYTGRYSTTSMLWRV